MYDKEKVYKWRARNLEQYKTSQRRTDQRPARKKRQAALRKERRKKDAFEASYAEHNRSRIRARTNQRRHELRKRCFMYLGGMRCSCGFESTIPAQFDFHHKTRTTKKFTITRAIADGLPFETIKPELNKCVVICKNCHGAIESQHPASNAIRILHGLVPLVNTDVEPLPPKPKKKCSVKGCSQASRSLGMCMKHYDYLRHTGKLPRTTR